MNPDPQSIRNALFKLASDGKGRDLDVVCTRLARKFNIPTQGWLYKEFRRKVYNAKKALIEKRELSKLDGHVRLSRTSKNGCLLNLCKAIFCRNNLMIKSEIEDVSVWRIKGGFPKSRPEKILVQFSISENALEKVLTEETPNAALQTLVNLTEPYP